MMRPRIFRSANALTSGIFVFHCCILASAIAARAESDLAAPMLQSADMQAPALNAPAFQSPAQSPAAQVPRMQSPAWHAPVAQPTELTPANQAPTAQTPVVPASSSKIKINDSAPPSIASALRARADVGNTTPLVGSVRTI